MFMAFGVVNDETANVIIPWALMAAGEASGEAKPWPGTDIIVGEEALHDAAMALIGIFRSRDSFPPCEIH